VVGVDLKDKRISNCK